MASLFGTSGIRGPVKELFTNQFCFDIGRAFAKFLAKKEARGAVAVGMDPRPSSQRIKKSFSAGLVYEKRKVFDEGICPAPAINYILIADPSFGGSVMITGSHIREDFNGIKFFAQKEEIFKKDEREIEEIYQNLKEKVPFKKNLLSFPFLKENKANILYQRMLFSLTELPYPKWKAVIDPGNGCQAKIMPVLLKKMGIKMIAINNNPEVGPFIARDTDAIESGGAVLEKLQERVKKMRADFGVAYDADGDRGVFVNEKGDVIPGDYVGTLIAKYSDTKVIVTPINTSQVVETLGKPVIRTKVGSPYVVEAMKKYGATFGFELNGGGVSAEIMMSRDLGSVTIKILNLLKKEGGSLSELINTLPKFFLHRIKINCLPQLNPLILKEVKKRYKGIKIEETDGIKIWLDKNTWILFRPSANAPEFRVFAEAKTKESAEKLAEEGIKFVKSLIKK